MVWFENGGHRLSGVDLCKWTFYSGQRLIVTFTMQAFILCSNHTAYGFNNFFPTIVEGFGLGTRTVTLLCTAPPYLVGALVSFGIAYSSDKRGERGWHISVPMAIAAVGFIISVATLNIPARYFASFLYVSGCFGANSIFTAGLPPRLAKHPRSELARRPSST